MRRWRVQVFWVLAGFMGISRTTRRRHANANGKSWRYAHPGLRWIDCLPSRPLDQSFGLFGDALIQIKSESQPTDIYSAGHFPNHGCGPLDRMNAVVSEAAQYPHGPAVHSDIPRR
jgi:hypothetical protein